MEQSPANINRRVHRLAAVSVVLAALSLVVPRFVPANEGFASAANATLVFLLLLGVATLVAGFLLLLTIRHYKALTISGRVTGIAPAVVMGGGMVALLLWLGY